MTHLSANKISFLFPSSCTFRVHKSTLVYFLQPFVQHRKAKAIADKSADPEFGPVDEEAMLHFKRSRRQNPSSSASQVTSSGAVTGSLEDMSAIYHPAATVSKSPVLAPGDGIAAWRTGSSQGPSPDCSPQQHQNVGTEQKANRAKALPTTCKLREASAAEGAQTTCPGLQDEHRTMPAEALSPKSILEVDHLSPVLQPIIPSRYSA